MAVMDQATKDRLLGVAQVQQNEEVAQQSPSVGTDVSGTDRQRLIDWASKVDDDSWGAQISDVGVGIAQGGTYNWIDEIAGIFDDDSELDAKQRYELALQRNPYSTLGGEFAGGAATDIGIATAAGASYGNPYTTAAGAVVGTGKALYRGSKILDKISALNRAKGLAQRTATFGAIGTTHGAVAGAGSADQFGQTRAEGALEGGLYGGAIGGAIPVGGSIIRGVGKGVNLAGRKSLQLAVKTPAVSRAIGKNFSDDALTFAKNPQASASSVAEKFTEFVNVVGDKTERAVRQGYDDLRQAGIAVDVGSLRGSFAKMAKRYKELGRNDVAVGIAKGLGKRDTVDFNDALLLRENIRALQRTGGLDYNDFDELYGSLTRAIGKGAEKKGVKGYWEDTQKVFHETRDFSKASLFKQGMSDDGIKEGNISGILNSQSPLSGWKGINREIDNLSKYDKEGASVLKDELQSYGIVQMLQNDGQILRKILARPDGDKILREITKGDAGLMSALKDFSQYATGRRDPEAATVSSLSNRTGRLLGLGLAFDAAGVVMGAALEFGGPVLAKRVMKSSKVRGMLKNLNNARNPSEAARYKKIIASEMLALGVVLPASFVALGE